MPRQQSSLSCMSAEYFMLEFIQYLPQDHPHSTSKANMHSVS